MIKKLLAFISSRRILILVLVLAAAAIGLWLYFRNQQQANGALTASGTVEAVTVQVASELSGKVLQINVDEGQSVKAGDVLFNLDDSLMQAQRAQAQAALQVAKDNLSASQSGVVAAEAALKTAQDTADIANANADAQLIPARQALKDLYDNHDVALSTAQQTLATATKAVRDAQYALDNFTVPSDQAGLTTEEALEKTIQLLDQARLNFEPYKYWDSGNATRKDLKDDLDNAQSAYDSAVRRMQLETALSQAKAYQAQAQQDVRDLQDGPKADDVETMQAKLTALEAAPRQAESTVEQARAAVTQAQDHLQQAQSSLTQSQAALDLIELQIQKSTITSPTNGVVLDRGIEPGEVVQAGAAVITIGDLSTLNITVYIPENLYGSIHLGQKALITVDSYPGKTFDGTVTYISDQAEFTPRNVQTVEGRMSTVYAVKLSLPNQGQALKPGMPADVNFK